VDYFPAFLDVRERLCVVIGGGEVAERKAQLLLRAQPRVKVVAPELCAAMAGLVRDGRLAHAAALYAPEHLNGALLVVAATDDAAINERVSLDARASNQLVNVVDQPALCSFIVPSIVDRSPVVVAISSSGAVPVLARTLRARIESVVPPRYAELAAVCAELRPLVKATLPTITARRRFWELALESPAVDRVLAGEREEGKRELATLLGSQGAEASHMTHPVSLVGTGPGDADLISFRALRLLQRAELVLSMPGVSAAVADLARRDAEQRSIADLAEVSVVAMIADHVARGQRVCVLGPYDVFRGPGSQAGRNVLAASGVRYDIVPGIERS
jgi:uroporphyrin-III C-methyltransferase/precorrin-2 dehydrogenase/sirohydrochlorin ferrochelatase